MIYTIAQLREEELRTETRRERGAAAAAPRRWWQLSLLPRRATDWCPPAPGYRSRCVDEQSA
jgi:hypothetical protein